MLRFACAIGAGVAVLLCIGGYMVVRNQRSPCETNASATFASPDRAWLAKRTEYVCDAGLGSDASWVVSLQRTTNPSDRKDVFAATDEGDYTRPIVAWSDNATLHINTRPNDGYTSLQLASALGIRIIYAYRSHQSSGRRLQQVVEPRAVWNSVLRMEGISDMFAVDAIERRLPDRYHESVKQTRSSEIRSIAADVNYQFEVVDRGREIIVTDPTQYQPAMLREIPMESDAPPDRCHLLSFSSTRGAFCRP